MRVLQIVDRVFVALLLSERHVEDEFRIGLARNQEVACCIAAGPVDQIAKRHVIARALAHLHGFAVLDDGEHLVKDVFREGLGD